MAITNISTGADGDAVSCSVTLISGSGNNRILLGIATQERVPVNMAGMTYNGVSGTQLFSTTHPNGNERIIGFYWLDADLPASAGTYTLQTTGPGIEIGISGFSCDGAAQNAPADSDSTTGTGTSASLSLTVTVDGVVFLGAGANATLTADAGQTIVLPSTNSGTYAHASSYDETDGNVGYTFSNSTYVIGAIAIEPAPGTAAISWLRI